MMSSLELFRKLEAMLKLIACVYCVQERRIFTWIFQFVLKGLMSAGLAVTRFSAIFSKE
ncbi:unnamed protein product [Arabidopsis halleri]